MTEKPATSLSSGEPGPDERLDSWKEIASYLRRSVSSVKRWEKEEGLPVRRHAHGKRGSVYAYREELDAWWAERAETANEEASPPSAFRGRIHLLVAAGGLTLLVAIGLLAWAELFGGLGELSPTRADFPRRLEEAMEVAEALGLENGDLVLVADAENLTGDEALDGALEAALRREIARSQKIGVLARERIEAALERIGMPREGPVDRETGRAICLAEPEAKVLVDGRLEVVGPARVATVELVDPAAGRTLARLTDEVRQDEDIPLALTRLAVKVRQALDGERPAPEPHRTELGEAVQSELPGSLPRASPFLVTTSSPDALELYEQALTAIEERFDHDAASALLARAIELDPDFAMAHLWLAKSWLEQDLPEEPWVEHSARARELAPRTSEAERLFIEGMWAAMRGSSEQAVPPLKAHLRLVPDNVTALDQLAVYLQVLGRDEEALEHYRRAAELRPQSFAHNFQAARAFTRLADDLDEAALYVERAKANLGAAIDRYPGHAAWLLTFPLREAWREGDLDRVEELLGELEHQVAASGRGLRESLARTVGTSRLLLGQLGEAERWFRRHATDADCDEGLLLIAYLRHDRAALEAQLGGCKQAGIRLSPFYGQLLARRGTAAGEIEPAIRGRHESYPIPFDAWQGELALRQGATEAGKARLEQILDTSRGRQSARTRSRFASFFLAGLTLAEVYENEGRWPRALEILEVLARIGERFAYELSGVVWQEVLARLGELERRLGNPAAALEAEQRLYAALARADLDHPLLRELPAIREARR